MKNLWPELRRKGGLTPLGILRRQASMLHRHTSGLLDGEIVTEVKMEQFVHRFYVVAPVLGNFRYHMCNLSHPVSPLYPVNVDLGGVGPAGAKGAETLADESKLTQWLERRFAAEKEILEQLLGDSLPDSELAETR